MRLLSFVSLPFSNFSYFEYALFKHGGGSFMFLFLFSVWILVKACRFRFPFFVMVCCILGLHIGLHARMVWIGLRGSPMMLLLGKITFTSLSVFWWVTPSVWKFLKDLWMSLILAFVLIENFVTPLSLALLLVHKLHFRS